MYRPIIRSLIKAVEQQEVRQLLLDGMPGAGKSVALSLLAQWARRKGWVVRTLPVLSHMQFYAAVSPACQWLICRPQCNIIVLAAAWLPRSSYMSGESRQSPEQIKI